MARKSTVFSCTDCGAQTQKWVGRCPECHAWNTFVEETPATGTASPANVSSSTGGPIPIDRIDFDSTPRLSTAYPHFDCVLGGGLVPGSVILVGGEPGIGKSTLLLQVAESLARLGRVLYVSGEESPKQIALRARRLGTLNPNISLYTETSVERIIAEIESMKPVAAVVDSIQTVYTAGSTSAAGSLAQVRDAAGMLMTAAKRLATPIFLIGHITKEGTIAGPKTLEHIVDTVLYFEGDKFQNGRMVRAYKNRFGPVNELAIYRMHDNGLEEIANPSEALIAERSGAAGSAIVSALEGTRPLMIELQGLVSVSHFPSPRRIAMGVDQNRLSLLVAVLEKKGGGSNILTHDIYVNVAGGLQLDEPALDAGIIAAVVSSQRNKPIAHDIALFGEVGLLGEIRGVSQPDLRAREAATLGFRRVIVPAANAAEIRADIDVVGVKRVEDLLAALF